MRKIQEKKEVQKSEEKEEGFLKALTVYTPLEPSVPFPYMPLLAFTACEWDSPAQQEKKKANPFLSTACAPTPPSGGSPTALSAVKKGIRQTRLEGDMEAFAFTVGLLLGRSNLTSKGVTVHTGIIDSDYKEKIKVIVSSSVPWTAKKGERIAQLLLLPYILPGKRGTQGRKTGGFKNTGQTEIFLAEGVCILPCFRPEGQKEFLQPYVADIPVNLWGQDLLTQ